MWTSVSAITDADDCLRRWWLNKVVKLPQDQRKATIFGDVTHAVAERYFLADDRGLTNGKPTDLFPDNEQNVWYAMKDRWSKEDTVYKVSPTEQALIRVLIDKAITEGVFVREPGRIVEKEINTAIYSKGFAKAILRGFIDLENPNEITDHKTAKNTKYILSKAKLKKSIQMMGYAKSKYIEGHQGTLWLTHNNFIKDFDRPQVIKRSVEVTEAEVNLFFEDTILPLVRRMMDIYLKYPKDQIQEWRKIPGANSPNQSCNFHYGHPCPYIGICGGTCSIETYLMKYNLTVDKLIGNTKQENIVKGNEMPPTNSLIVRAQKEMETHAASVAAVPVVAAVPAAAAAVATEVTEVPAVVAPATVGLSEMLANMAAKEVAPVAVAEVIPVAVAPITEVPAVAEVPAVVGPQVAPWCTPHADGTECAACKDSKIRGYNYKLDNACRICDINAQNAGKPTSKDYTVTTNADGTLTFTLNTAEAPAVTVAPIAAAEVKTEITPVVAPVVPVAAVVDIRPTVAEAGDNLLANMASLAAADVVPLAIANIPVAAPKDVVAVNAGVAIAEASKETRPEKTGEGFTLMIGCTFLGESPVTPFDADGLVRQVLSVAAKAAGKADASLIEHFALMQAIDSAIPALVAQLGNDTVVSLVPAKGSAHARMIEGLRMYAKTIIYPFAV